MGIHIGQGLQQARVTHWQRSTIDSSSSCPAYASLLVSCWWPSPVPACQATCKQYELQLGSKVATTHLSPFANCICRFFCCAVVGASANGFSACRLGEGAEEGELQLGSKLLGNAPLSTRERIRRDRELHRLGLNLVDRVPKDVLVDLVQVSSLD